MPFINTSLSLFTTLAYTCGCVNAEFCRIGKRTKTADHIPRTANDEAELLLVQLWQNLCLTIILVSAIINKP